MSIRLNHSSPIDSAKALIDYALERPELHPKVQEYIRNNKEALERIIEQLAGRMDRLDLGSRDLGNVVINQWDQIAGLGLQSLSLQVLRPGKHDQHNEVLMPFSHIASDANKAPQGMEWYETKSPTLGAIVRYILHGELDTALVKFGVNEGTAELVQALTPGLRMDNKTTGEVDNLDVDANPILIQGPEAVRTYTQITKGKKGVSPEDIRDLIHEGLYACGFLGLRPIKG